MNSGRVIVAVVAVLVVVAAIDALRSDGSEAAPAPRQSGYVIDISSSRSGTWLPAETLRDAFPRPRPRSVAISKVAVAPDEVVAVALSYVPGGDARSRAAIELWDGDTFVRAFSVPSGSFSLGMWFAGEGAEAIATIGWDERGHLYDREGRSLRGNAYFAYETG